MRETRSDHITNITGLQKSYLPGHGVILLARIALPLPSSPSPERPLVPQRWDLGPFLHPKS